MSQSPDLTNSATQSRTASATSIASPSHEFLSSSQFPSPTFHITASATTSPIPMQFIASPGMHGHQQLNQQQQPQQYQQHQHHPQHHITSAFPPAGNQALFPHMTSFPNSNTGGQGGHHHNDNSHAHSADLWSLPSSPSPYGQFGMPNAANNNGSNANNQNNIGITSQHGMNAFNNHGGGGFHSFAVGVGSGSTGTPSPGFAITGTTPSPGFPINGISPAFPNSTGVSPGFPINTGISPDPYAGLGAGVGFTQLGLVDEDDIARDMSFSQEGASHHDDVDPSEHPYFPNGVNPLESGHGWIESPPLPTLVKTQSNPSPQHDSSSPFSTTSTSRTPNLPTHQIKMEPPALNVYNYANNTKYVQQTQKTEQPPPQQPSLSSQDDDFDENDADEVDDDMANSKKRKLGQFKPARMTGIVQPIIAPPTARVCELGLINKQVSGNLCWTSYQKVSATDRSCLALLCSIHSDEAATSSGGTRYTQFVPQELLLQVGLGIERKPLERIILSLQSSGKLDNVLVLRIRRAVPGRVKTGPEYCQMLLFASSASRQVGEVALAAYLLPAEAKIGFPAPLVPFSCDFTKRCVWLVPKQLCVGGQFMIPTEAGQLHTSAAPSVAHTIAIPPTPSSPNASVITHSQHSVTTAGGNGTHVSSQIPLFSALSLHAPPSLEDATYVRVIRSLKSSHKMMSLSEGEDPYSTIQLQFNDLEREVVRRFKKFPQREAIFQDELTIDLYISKTTFLAYALEILFDLTWPNEQERTAEQSRWSPILNSLFLIVSLPTTTTRASSLTFTQFMRLYAWLRPDAGWIKPKVFGSSGSNSSSGSDSSAMASDDWTDADRTIDPHTHRSPMKLYILSQTFALLTFLHRSLKFFQSYIKKPNRFVFATRASLEADERFQKFNLNVKMEIQNAAVAAAAASSSSSSAAAAYAASSLLFCPQLRFCEGHIAHLTEDSQEPLYRDIVLSYTWMNRNDGIVHKFEHIPLLRQGKEGYYVFHGDTPCSNLNFLLPASTGDESVLHELTCAMHLELMEQRATKMEGSEAAVHEYGSRAIPQGK